jgi:hypothetical protein
MIKLINTLEITIGIIITVAYITLRRKKIFKVKYKEE